MIFEIMFIPISRKYYAKASTSKQHSGMYSVRSFIVVQRHTLANVYDDFGKCY